MLKQNLFNGGLTKNFGVFSGGGRVWCGTWMIWITKTDVCTLGLHLDEVMGELAVWVRFRKLCKGDWIKRRFGFLGDIGVDC